MIVIETSHLTKDYGNQKGVFDVNIQIEKGEVYGYLGPNGAGKSTTMRHLMGFSKPDEGETRILGLDCWSKQKQIQTKLGYLPGEITFPNDMNGKTYLHMIASMRNQKDMNYAHELLDIFKIDPNMSLKRMSKGMKQKIGIVSAFMHDPDILLLDEPTSGLDPLMQNHFLELVEKEKAKGKTILMSSHIFEEVERTCDRIGMIKNGTLIQEIAAKDLRQSRLKTYKVEFKEPEALQNVRGHYPDAICNEQKKQALISIQDEQINELLQFLGTTPIVFLKEEKHTLEEYFMQFYGGEAHD